jgi:hypothetical protein
MKNAVRMSSSRKRVSKILGAALTPTDAERLLVDWANLPDLPYSANERKLLQEKLTAGIPVAPPDECRRLVKRNVQVFGPNALDWEWGGVSGFGLTAFDLIETRDLLRRVWTAPERRSREWYSFHLRLMFYGWEARADFIRNHPVSTITDPGWSKLSYFDPPPVTPFEASVFYLQTSIAERAKRCGNSDCPAPYFIAVKKWQKFCSEKCAGPANRESKRQWWRDNRAKNGGVE